MAGTSPAMTMRGRLVHPILPQPCPILVRLNLVHDLQACSRRTVAAGCGKIKWEDADGQVVVPPADAPAPPCLRGEGPGKEPAVLRGYPGHPPRRDVVRAAFQPVG